MKESLSEELRQIQALFMGAYYAVARQIGMTLPDREKRAAAAYEDQFRTWRMTNDPDVDGDVRMMVPVFYDRARGKTKVWVFMGWSAKPLVITYAKYPKARIFDQEGKEVASENVNLIFGYLRRSVAYPVTAEVYVSEILNRDEFRLHCDKYKTQTAILGNLK